MPLLEVIQTRHLSASIRLTDTTAAQVDQYAAFIHASADEVVEQALAYVFSKDRDFQEFLKSAEAQKITPTLRVRRAAASGYCRAASEEACKRCCQRQHFGDIRGGIKGMIRSKNRWQCHNGASHRNNLDTPSLKGLRLEPVRFQTETYGETGT